MAFKPWLTSDDLIENVKIKSAVPVSQNTFSDEDILRFATDELMTTQVPSVMMYHEEYFVFSKEVELETDVLHYAIPDRAIGLKLRDVNYKDDQSNLYEMTRVNAEDKAFFQNYSGSNTSAYKYYLQGNDLVLTPGTINEPSGSLVFYYFLRPNVLVKNNRAAIIKSFVEQVTVLDNSLVTVGDTVTIKSNVFTAVAGAAGALQFQIGASAAQTATNLTTSINTADIGVTANNGSPSTATITLYFSNIKDSRHVTASDTFAFNVPETQGIQFESISDIFTNGLEVDLLQTKPGHRSYNIDVMIPSNGISGDIINFNLDDVSDRLIVGDYMCLASECIIPQIPTDLHSGLAERVVARMMAAIGDQSGLQASQAKIAENLQAQGMMLDSRVEGSPVKVLPRHSILRYGKSGRNNF